MTVQIRAKGITLNDHARAHVQSAVEAFEKFGLDITTVNVVITTEKQGVAVEFDIHIAHAQPVVINQNDDDLDTAIDLAIDRASKALRRLHTKVASPAKGSIKDLETVDV
ncbi:MAG TPA: ribosomal subunit interface protein [Sulfurimonas sp. UBA12504]|nr:MAG: ribosomal subunit interface protein [Sulfurimonas sp. GWF2_37_8]DAB30835.1 MAG TPA: ribosomal subunit interface protein [Sulfurimonas sp. UBA12504]